MQSLNCKQSLNFMRPYFRRCARVDQLPVFPYNRGGFIYRIVGVYIPIIRIPTKGGMTIPNIGTFDHGTDVEILC